MRNSNKHLHIEQVKNVKCTAIADGYFQGRVIKAGKIFTLEGPIVNGKFPLWCKPVESYETAFSKLSESQQFKHLNPSKNISKDGEDISDLNKQIEELKAQLEAKNSEEKEEVKEDKSESLDENNNPFHNADSLI